MILTVWTTNQDSVSCQIKQASRNDEKKKAEMMKKKKAKNTHLSLSLRTNH